MRGPRQPARATLAGVALCFAALPALADFAAITSQTADRLTVLDLDSGEVVVSMPLAGKPAALAVDAARGRIYAIAVETEDLHVFDLEGRPLRAWPLKTAGFAVAVEAATGHLLVTDMGGAVLTFDPRTGAVLSRRDAGAMTSGIDHAEGVTVVANRDANSVTIYREGDSRSVTVGEHPFGVTLHDSRAFVTNVLSDSVSVIDLARAEVLAEIETGERPYAVAFAAGKGFVTNQYGASLTVFDAGTLAPLAEIATDDYPEGISATPDGRRIVVANWFADTVQIIDAESLEVTRTIEVPAGPRAFGRFTWAKE